jgi:hypothetical protein
MDPAQVKPTSKSHNWKDVSEAFNQADNYPAAGDDVPALAQPQQT